MKYLLTSNRREGAVKLLKWLPLCAVLCFGCRSNSHLTSTTVTALNGSKYAFLIPSCFKLDSAVSAGNHYEWDCNSQKLTLDMEYSKNPAIAESVQVVKRRGLAVNNDSGLKAFYWSYGVGGSPDSPVQAAAGWEDNGTLGMMVLDSHLVKAKCDEMVVDMLSSVRKS